jgi:hypothetical protein
MQSRRGPRRDRPLTGAAPDTRFTHDQELTVHCGGPMTDGYNGCSDWDDALGSSWPYSVRMSVQYDMG